MMYPPMLPLFQYTNYLHTYN